MNHSITSTPITRLILFSNRGHALFLALTGFGCLVLACGATANVIEDENLQSGTTAWQLTNPAENRQIEGYASLTSVLAGNDIDLFVNTKEATYSLIVYRMGWYGGKGGRKVFGPQTLTGVQQVMPTADPTTGLIECNWTNPYTIHVPTAWVSGVYLVKLHANTSGKESYIIFTVRDTRSADIVFQQSVTTYQAYNPWPGWDLASGYVGASLYSYSSNINIPNNSVGTPNQGQVSEVSFNRPYGRGPQAATLYGVGAGDFLTHDFGGFGDPATQVALANGGTSAWEFGMIRWLEHHAYDVTYITNVDTHEDVNRLLRGKAFLSIGHDEYWSEDMKTNVKAARDQGVNLGFFSGNYVYWPVDLIADSSGNPSRGISLAPATYCEDSSGNVLATQCIADSDCGTNQTCVRKDKDFAAKGESEQLLVGGMWDSGHLGNGDIVVTADAQLNHWVFANTGLQVGDVIPGLIGYEYDVFRSDLPKPGGLDVLLHTQAPDFTNSPYGGGFPLPNDFDGKSFDAWYAAVKDFAAHHGGQFDIDTKQCANDGSVCTQNSDCGTDANGNQISCLFPCHSGPVPPFGLDLPPQFCANPYPQAGTVQTDWAMTIYQVNSGAYVFNTGTVQWSWALDDYFTGLTTADGANNGPAVRTQCGYSFFNPGLVSCRSDAVAQITRNVLTKFQGQDTTAPESTLTIGTPQYSGTNQLFVSDATPFTLTATDDASGIWNVWYRVFPAGSSSPPSYTSVDGFQTNFSLSGTDGSYEVDSYATDNASNDESPAHIQSVYLDNTAPVTTISTPEAKQYLHSDMFTISYSVSDGNGSGVKSAVPDIDGQTTLSNGATQATVANGLLVNLLTELTLGTHTFNVNSVDNVGNAGTATVTFSIIVTVQSIITEVKYFRSIGAITQNEASSLLQKLNASAAYRARGDCKDANIVYKAFVHELQAQSGKKVTVQAATILITDAQYLIAHCP